MKRVLEAHEAAIESGAREKYQAQVQNVALQLLPMFMTQNMMRDVGQLIRDSQGVKAPRELSEMLDLSIRGAIHFVTEISKLKPRAEFVEQVRASASILDLSLANFVPPLPPSAV